MVRPGISFPLATFELICFYPSNQGSRGAHSAGMSDAPVTVAESVAGILSHIDGATREKTSGRFWNFAITEGHPWDLQTAEVPW